MSDYMNPDEGDETAGAEGAGAKKTFKNSSFAPEGDYEVIVMAAAFGTSKASGADQIVLNLSAPECPGAASKYYITNTPRAKWRFDSDLRALGLEPPSATHEPEYEAERDFVGKKLIATAKHDVFNGRPDFKFVAVKATPEGPGARAFGG